MLCSVQYMTTKIKHSHLFREFLKESFDAGLNDTIADDTLTENAQLLIDEKDSIKRLTGKQRELLLEAYIKGFKRGL